MDLQESARRWMAEDPDPETRAELAGILERGDQRELAERFGSRLEFGTAGLRGILGAGPNRMNRVVVLRTTAGLAAYLNANVPDVGRRGVVIGYDGRKLSPQAAEDAAAVLAGAGIPALVFRRFAPTPLTAFAVRHLNAAAGIMITASHNPAEYNGYKVYWGNGAQIIPPHDGGISAAIEAVGPVTDIPRLGEHEAHARGLHRWLGEDVEGAYLEAVAKLSIAEGGRDRVTIVYTPMHGVGGELAVRALSQAGFNRVHVVEEQMDPDPNFPTVRFPNPEEPGAMDLALALAARVKADLVIANDPDADRLAVAVRRGEKTVQLTGNQLGVLMAGHLLLRDPRPPGDRLVITTIVSSPMLGRMARDLSVRYDEVLTGFKWIANRAMELEARTGTRFVFGYEEALGYSVSTVCRDKDGIGAAAVVAEMAADAKERGTDLLGDLEELYRRFGVHVSRQHSVTMPGSEGQERIRTTMARFRERPPASVGELPVEVVRDYQRGVAIRGGTEEALELPRSNVLAWELGGGSRITLRPSGTEPKIKFYFDLRETVRPGESVVEAEARAGARLDVLQAAFLALVG
jgi:phosphomannomutase